MSVEIILRRADSAPYPHTGWRDYVEVCTAYTTSDYDSIAYKWGPYYFKPPCADAVNKIFTPDDVRVVTPSLINDIRRAMGLPNNTAFYRVTPRSRVVRWLKRHKGKKIVMEVW